MKGNDIMTAMNVAPLEGKKKKRWTIVFVVIVFLISLSCLGVMNYNYDVLARYPYKDERSRQLIREYLNEEEISYIIEYSIPPNMFISFIQEPRFNIYHAAEYKKVSETLWQETPARIVEIVEDTYDLMDTDTLIWELTEQYTYEELEDWIHNGTPYTPDAALLAEPEAVDAWLDEDVTIARHEPRTLVTLSDVPTLDNVSIQVASAVQEPLASLCGAIQVESGSANACAGLSIEEGYVSYDEQAAAYDSAETTSPKSVEAPGQDEHQLGTAVDFAVAGLADEDFAKTWQSDWLAANAWKYGFVQTRTEEDAVLQDHVAEAWHYRYVGTELARTLHDNGLTLARYKISQSGTQNVIARK